MDEQELAAIEQRCITTRRELKALCEGRPWVVSVPPRADDSDVILLATLCDVWRLLEDRKIAKGDGRGICCVRTGRRDE